MVAMRANDIPPPFPLLAYLPWQCPLYTIPGRLYPVDIIYCDLLEGKDLKKYSCMREGGKILICKCGILQLSNQPYH